MLHYPKIPGSGAAPLGRCIAFEKYDGTNFHFDWDRDFGWHAFGTRRDAFNLLPEGVAAFHEAHPGLEECVRAFEASLSAGVESVFRENEFYRPFQALRVFAEYLGPYSFAGMHRPGDVMGLKLFDVEVEGRGFVDPWRFVADFGHLPACARVVYQGKYTGQLVEDVRRGRFDVAEGVVVKGGQGPDVWMCKIKTLAYLERLRQSFAEGWEDYWE